MTCFWPKYLIYIWQFIAKLKTTNSYGHRPTGKYAGVPRRANSALYEAHIVSSRLKWKRRRDPEFVWRKPLYTTHVDAKLRGWGWKHAFQNHLRPRQRHSLNGKCFIFIFLNDFPRSRMQRHYIDYAVTCSNNILNVRRSVLEGYTRVHLFGFSLICVIT